MTEMNKWGGHGEIKPEEEAEYLKDLCAYLREQQTLSGPEINEDGIMTCEVVLDEIAAHAADVIEELWGRLQEKKDEPAPVAWMVYTLDGESAYVTANPTDFTAEHRVLPLYATPLHPSEG